jgi:hypothetical protein
MECCTGTGGRSFCRLREGLLWYDDDPSRGLEEKVALAARHYRRKYGAMPDLCYVHPSMLGSGPEVRGACRGGVQVCGLHTVLRHHLWLGCVNDSS